MRLAAFLVACAGGLLALLSLVGVFLVVADESLGAQLGIAALFAVAVIALAGVGLRSRHTRTAGVSLIMLSSVALVLGLFSAIFGLRPLLFGYALSLVGGILMLFAPKVNASSDLYRPT